MATRIRYQLGDGVFSVPAVYGGGILSPGASMIIADTTTNVALNFVGVPSYVLEIVQVPDNQSGAVTPGTPVATSVANAAASATLAAVSATAAAGSAATSMAQIGYTGTTSGWWTGSAPTSMANALDRLAKTDFVGNPSGITGLIKLYP